MTKNANTEDRRQKILTLVAQGKEPWEISAALGTTPEHFKDALAYAWTTPRSLARARRAQRTADLVHRGVPLPVAASLQGLATITALRDLQVVARLDALRRPKPAGEFGRCVFAGAVRWRGTGMHKDARRVRADMALIAVLDGRVFEECAEAP